MFFFATLLHTAAFDNFFRSLYKTQNHFRTSESYKQQAAKE